jgi:hypothetical protein
MNKVTKEYIESQIEETSFTRPKGTLTMCYLTLNSGFILTGESACIDPAKFDEKLGRDIAYENAFDKAWELFGFHFLQKKHDEMITIKVDA